MTEHGSLLSVEDLTIAADGDVQRTIVSKLHLSVDTAETIGIVGESGSGKSMTARAIVGLLPHGVRAVGQIVYRGRNLLDPRKSQLSVFRGSEITLLTQDPFTMLNPLLPAGKHIEETLRANRQRKAGKQNLPVEAIRRLAEVGIGDPTVARRYAFQLSGGMRQRVGLAAALAQDPKILIADEPSSALDVTTQKEILDLVTSIQRSRGMALILITHDLRVAFSTCDRVYVLYAGTLLETGPAQSLEAEPLHPYTLGLLLSEPLIERRLPELPLMRGSVPSADDVASTCSFAPRCQWVQLKCTLGRPALRQIEANRWSACVRIEEIRQEFSRSLAASHDAAPVVPTQLGKDLVLTRHLDKSFYMERLFGGRRTVLALRDVSIQVGVNESVGLVGESGSGKTTLARCLVGLEAPTGGEIIIDGIIASNYSALRSRERSQVRRSIQIIFQDPYSSLNPTWSVSDALREALRLGGMESNRDAVGDLLQEVGLPANYATRKPVALSGGERQRVAIARALASRPKVIVCDEPVSALDVSVQSQILSLFRTLQAKLGISFLFITHDLAVVRQVADRVYVLHRGEIVESGAVDEVLDRPKHAYTRLLIDSIPAAPLPNNFDTK
jgi:peptide/nickel transport system ATP-binding protein